MKFFAKSAILLSVVILTSIPTKALESYTRSIAPDGTIVWIYDNKIDNSEDYIRYYVKYCDKSDGNIVVKLKYDKKTHQLGVITRSPNNVKFADIENVASNFDKDTKMQNLDANPIFTNANKKVLEILHIKEEPIVIVKEDTEPKDIQEWLDSFQKKVKSNWKPNKENDGNLKTVVEFYVKKDGTLDTYKVKQSSGNEEYDRHALETLVKSQPFRKLPKSYSDKLLVAFTFKFNDYNQMDEHTVYKEWWKDFQNKVQTNWQPTATSKTENEYKTTVSFFIADDGDVEDYKITTSSGSSEFDNYVIKTLIAGQPYKPMPKEGTEKVPIKFTFTFNQDNNSVAHSYFEENVKPKVEKKWKPSKTDINKEIELKVVLSQEGKVKECSVIKSTGNEISDERAIKAVYKSAPFKEVEGKYLDYGKEETSDILKLSK